MIRKITLLIGMSLLVAAVGYSQAPAAPAQNSPSAAAPSTSDKTFEGRLTKVDAATKTITVATLNPQDGDAKDMTFKYSDQTVVVGGDRTVQGLDGKTGSTLKITFQPDHENNNMASRIEISDKQ
jgi:Cu/Ag efflux protein CusF